MHCACICKMYEYYLQDVCKNTSCTLMCARYLQDFALKSCTITKVQDFCVIDLAIVRVLQDLVYRARLLQALASPF